MNLNVIRSDKFFQEYTKKNNGELISGLYRVRGFMEKYIH